MPRLLLANSRSALGQANASHAIWSMLLLWQMRDDDIIVVPMKPAPGHVEYIAALTKTRRDSLHVIVAPEGSKVNLVADRVANPELVAMVRQALGGRRLEAIVPMYPDASVAQLARLLGCESAYQGAAFARQGGGLIANSKTIFRAIAMGNGVPVPEGVVVDDAQEAELVLVDMLLEQGVPVMMKKDFAQACMGNEVLSATEGVDHVGGRRGYVLPDRAAIKGYLAERWAWLTDEGRHRVVIERFFPDSVAIFAEFQITDAGIELGGLGEMIAKPVADGQVIPPATLSGEATEQIVAAGRRLSEAMYAIGYRGFLSADAIVSAERTVYFTEFNGRITGSTHIYNCVGERLVGKDWMQRRILLERQGLTIPTFQGAVEGLDASGLSFNPETETGVVLTGDYALNEKTIGYTVVAEDLPAAATIEKRLHQIFPREPRKSSY